MTESSIVSYRVGGREYPMKTVRQCKVCRSPYRFDIEQAIVLGRTYRKIIEHLPEDHELTSENVKNHYLNGHLPMEVSVTRQIVEKRAEQVGKSIEDSVDSLIDGMTLAQTVVQKTFESIARGEQEPDIREGLAAAKLLAVLGEYDDGGLDMAAITEAFMVYHESAQEFMSPDQFEAFGKALSKNPVLKALARRYEGEVVEGEVEESRVLAEKLDSD